MRFLFLLTLLNISPVAPSSSLAHSASQAALAARVCDEIMQAYAQSFPKDVILNSIANDPVASARFLVDSRILFGEAIENAIATEAGFQRTGISGFVLPNHQIKGYFTRLAKLVDQDGMFVNVDRVLKHFMTEPAVTMHPNYLQLKEWVKKIIEEKTELAEMRKLISAYILHSAYGRAHVLATDTFQVKYPVGEISIQDYKKAALAAALGVAGMGSAIFLLPQNASLVGEFSAMAGGLLSGLALPFTPEYARRVPDLIRLKRIALLGRKHGLIRYIERDVPKNLRAEVENVLIEGQEARLKERYPVFY